MSVERFDVEFSSSGELCRGWLYLTRAEPPRPAIILTHGFSATIEQGLDPFARAFAAAGLTVLAFDYRDLGYSQGQVRGRILASRQQDDLRAALDWLSHHDRVDPGRIALWGFSYSGGHALLVGALDPRVAAIVAVAPALDILASFRAQHGDERMRDLLAFLASAQAEQSRSGASPQLDVVARPGETCVLDTPDAFVWFTRNATPGWHSTTTVESVARMIEYRPSLFIDLIAPKPLLVLAGQHDALIPLSQMYAAFAAAGANVETKFFDCGHFDFLPGGCAHEAAIAECRAWLNRVFARGG